ncbi:protein Lines homolog 1 [Pelodytes ibericus]
MEDLFPFLRRLYKTVLHAAPLHEDFQKYVSSLVPHIPNVPLESPDTVSWHPRDVLILQLSLVKMLVFKAEDQTMETAVKHQYIYLVEQLQQANVETAMIQLFETDDKVLSHLASKCLSCLVLFQLKCQSEVNIQWLQFCLKTLSDYPEWRLLLPCLTSLICVCKGILLDETVQQADILLKLLGPLHPVFKTFSSSILSTQGQQSPSQEPEFASNLSSLLDLFEILVALRLELKVSVSLCQHIITIYLPQALALVSSSLPYFVKKQVILVLKKCLLHKAGEDFLPSAHCVSQKPDPLFEQDMTTLAEALMSTVNQCWLLQVPVHDQPSSFGGADEASESSPDLVILGAVSLSVLKALEVQLHTTTISSTVAVNLQNLMGRLQLFLKHHLPWKACSHPCAWLCLTFIEQDDDMLEAAHCLLKLYIKCQSHLSISLCSEDQVGVWSGHLHQFGCNPHCIFLYLLKNVAFDASVLLDFLISSETCFLEYFVRYLKLLKDDWAQFCLICSLVDKQASSPESTSHGHSMCTSRVQTPVVESATCPAHLESYRTVTAQSSESGFGANTTQSVHPIDCDYLSSLDALQRLVAYDSSEESDSECVDKEESSVPVLIRGADSTAVDAQAGSLEPITACPGLHIASVTAHIEHDTCLILGSQQKFIRCMDELQEAIYRLQIKKLFPYNPSALLRLLTQISVLKGDTQ